MAFLGKKPVKFAKNTHFSVFFIKILGKSWKTSKMGHFWVRVPQIWESSDFVPPPDKGFLAAYWNSAEFDWITVEKQSKQAKIS